MLKRLKTISPILLFFVLFVPYQIINQEFIVDWLGCGCPVVDEYGNVVKNVFNANDFSACFWGFVALCAVVLSYYVGKNIFDKRWARILYLVIILILSVIIATYFSVAFRWK